MDSDREDTAISKCKQPLLFRRNSATDCRGIHRWIITNKDGNPQGTGADKCIEVLDFFVCCIYACMSFIITRRLGI